MSRTPKPGTRETTKSKQEPLVIRARINSGEPESIRVLHSNKAPELSQIFRGVPIRFSTNLFQKALRVVSISVEKGVNVFHCTTDASGNSR